MTTTLPPTAGAPDPGNPTPDETPAPGRRTLTAALAAAPVRTLLGVLAFVLLAGALGGGVSERLEAGDGTTPSGTESVAAAERIEELTGETAVGDLALLAPVADAPAVAADLAAVDGVATVAPPLPADDGSVALVAASIDADADGAEVAAAVLEAFEGDDDVDVGGAAVANEQIGATVGADLGRAELFALPLLVLLSLLFFRGRAALLPVVVGATTVLGTFLAITVVDLAYPMSVFALNLVIGLGLGLAIDYSLFLVTRYREEVARQGVGVPAVLTTMRTAGRTVAYSAATVAVAMVTLTVMPANFVRSMGIAGTLVAVVAALAALVITPAVLARWGGSFVSARGSEEGAPGRAPSATADRGAWYRVSHAVMRRPGAVAAVTAVVMLLLAAPALRTDWAPIDGRVVPTDQSARVVSDALATELPTSGTNPVTLVLETGDAGAAAAATGGLAGLPGVLAVGEPRPLGASTVQVDVVVDGPAAGDEAQEVVAAARALDEPFDVRVTGDAASFVDQQATLADSLPLVAGLMVLLTLLVLWLMTGSVVLPLLAVGMNVLTVGVALGAITWVYADGRFSDLLGYTPVGGVEPTNFVITAAVVFALSTDYGVFMLGRIKEVRDGGAGERESVATGLQRTGYVVTAAALLLAVAIGAFSTSSISFIQQIGIGVAVAVLVDAFVVRTFLVPGLLGLLDKWSWWSPMWLRRVHDRVGLEH